MTGALWWKDSAKVLPCLQFARWWNSLLTRSCNSKSNLRLSRIFVVRFRGEKKCERMQTVILMFFFDFSLLNIFGTQSSEQLQKKKSNLLHVRFACAQTYLDWRTLVKKSAKILICFCFCFLVCKIMEFLTHEELYSKELFMPLPHFWSTIPQRKKCEHMQKPWSEHAKNHDPNMQKVVCYEAARNFVYQIYSRV